MVQSIVLILHVAACLMIIALVLLQRGKGADAGTGFGAGASGTVFGARGSASFLSRATAALATAFFVTSLALAYLGSQATPQDSSILERTAPAQQTEPQLAPPVEDLDAPPATTPADESPISELPDLEVDEEPAPAEGPGTN